MAQRRKSHLRRFVILVSQVSLLPREHYLMFLFNTIFVSSLLYILVQDDLTFSLARIFGLGQHRRSLLNSISKRIAFRLRFLEDTYKNNHLGRKPTWMTAKRRYKKNSEGQPRCQRKCRPIRKQQFPTCPFLPNPNKSTLRIQSKLSNRE
jgi:hypothetical protein